MAPKIVAMPCQCGCVGWYRALALLQTINIQGSTVTWNAATLNLFLNLSYETLK